MQADWWSNVNLRYDPLWLYPWRSLLSDNLIDFQEDARRTRLYTNGARATAPLPAAGTTAHTPTRRPARPPRPAPPPKGSLAAVGRSLLAAAPRAGAALSHAAPCHQLTPNQPTPLAAAVLDPLLRATKGEKIDAGFREKVRGVVVPLPVPPPPLLTHTHTYHHRTPPGVVPHPPTHPLTNTNTHTHTHTQPNPTHTAHCRSPKTPTTRGSWISSWVTCPLGSSTPTHSPRRFGRCALRCTALRGVCCHTAPRRAALRSRRAAASVLRWRRFSAAMRCASHPPHCLPLQPPPAEP